MRVKRGDLAALSLRAHDELRDAVAYLEGRALREGETVQVTIAAVVTRTPSGSLIFDRVYGKASHDV